MVKNKGKALVAGKEVGGKGKTLAVAEKGMGVENKTGKRPGRGKRQKLQSESERSGDDEGDTDEEVEGNDLSAENEVEEDEETAEEDSSKETKGKLISSKGAKKKSTAEGSKKISKSDLAQEEDVEVEKDKKRKRRGADREMVEAFLSPDNDFLMPGRRKEKPSFRKVDLSENDYERIVGKRVKVFWSGSRRWFLGRIKSFDNVKKLHKILYDDGDKEEVDLKQERFELEVVTSDGFSLSSNLRVSREKKVIGSSGAEANEETKQDTSSKSNDSATDTSSSEIEQRNEKPVFQKVDMSENDNERVVGKRVKVYWSGSKKWFIGRIKSFDRKKKLHKILYEDGDKEDVNLRVERFQLEVVPSDNFAVSNLSVKKKEDSVTVGDAAAGKKRTHKNKDDSVVGGDAVQGARPKRGTRKENRVTPAVEKEESENSEASGDEVEESQSGEENAQAGKSEACEDETLNGILKSYKSTRQGNGHKSGK